ncbi:unnamed protein product [Darwinula stevensoni]|uniref:C-type lectin domain-containing protein n=1 Tax=Darwinula stevensoni TaxID=69355 RepID=A0A7R9A3H2_9CRUS|nr:unnamed protein product [Darwinula stevensoni]CAG0890682.1 unnamed protein product [Darwinula stevensoni]
MIRPHAKLDASGREVACKVACSRAEWLRSPDEIDPRETKDRNGGKEIDGHLCPSRDPTASSKRLVNEAKGQFGPLGGSPFGFLGGPQFSPQEPLYGPYGSLDRPYPQADLQCPPGFKCVPAADCKYQCPPGYEEIAEGCYHIPRVSKQRSDAAAYCAERKADLVTVESRREYDAIVTRIGKDPGKYFTSSRRQANGKFQWETTSADMDTFNTGTVVDLTTGDCVVLTPGGFQAVDCNESNFFICEIATQGKHKCMQSTMGPEYRRVCCSDTNVESKPSASNYIYGGPNVNTFNTQSQDMCLINARGDTCDRVSKEDWRRAGSSFFKLFSAPDREVDHKVSWQDASSECREHYDSKLATLTSRVEDEFVTTWAKMVIDSDSCIWIGAYYSEAERRFVFVDGTPVENANWGRNEMKSSGFVALVRENGRIVWKVLDRNEECEFFFCEIKIRMRSGPDPRKKARCGARAAGGALARSLIAKKKRDVYGYYPLGMASRSSLGYGVNYPGAFGVQQTFGRDISPLGDYNFRAPQAVGYRGPGGVGLGYPSWPDKGQRGGSIAGTNSAQYLEWPWQVAIYKFKKQWRAEPDFICSGAMIDDMHVICAAHCVAGGNPAEFQCGIGEWDLSSLTYELYDPALIGSFQALNVLGEARVRLLPDRDCDGVGFVTGANYPLGQGYGPFGPGRGPAGGILCAVRVENTGTCITDPGSILVCKANTAFTNYNYQGYPTFGIGPRFRRSTFNESNPVNNATSWLDILKELASKNSTGRSKRANGYGSPPVPLGGPLPGGYAREPWQPYRTPFGQYIQGAAYGGITKASQVDDFKPYGEYSPYPNSPYVKNIFSGNQYLENAFYLVGIITSNYHNSCSNRPIIFTDITAYLEFILNYSRGDNY